MISVCNKQNLDSLLAKSLEYNGELLMTMLQSIGTKSGDPVEFSIQGDDDETLANYKFVMPDKSPMNDTAQPTIDLENTVKEFLNLAEEKYALLSALPKSEPSTDGQMKTSYTMTLSFCRMKIDIELLECCNLSGENCFIC